MELGKVFIDAVSVGARMRSLDPDNVERIKRSIKAIGLQDPIHVWSPDNERVELVAGLHRLKAMEALGETEIPCFFVNLNENARRRWEIAENLHRGELTVLEREEHVAEWIRLTEEAQRISSQVETKMRGRPEGGVNAAARELGVKKAAAHRAIKVDAIAPDAKEAARAAGLADNQSALLKVAAAPKERQVDIVGEIVRKREYSDPAEASEKRIKSVQDAYLRLSAEEKHVFLEWLEENEPAIFDATPAGRAA